MILNVSAVRFFEGLMTRFASSAHGSQVIGAIKIKCTGKKTEAKGS